MNKVMAVGTVEKAPELRFAGASQRPTTSFHVVVKRSWTSGSGEKREETFRVEIVAWGRTAETAVQHLVAGSEVLVEGRLNSRDGVPGSVHVVADRLVIMAITGARE